MKAKILILLASLGYFSLACGNNSGSGEYARDTASYASDNPKMAQEAYAESGHYSGNGETVPEKKVIRTARLSIQVADYEEALAEVKTLIETLDAELVSENEQQYGERLENQMTIRVVPGKLDTLLEALESLAAYVDMKSVNAEDVTRQYIDLETRLASKRAVLERYRELLKQAKTVEEIVTVEENLRKIVEEIESVEAQLRYLSRQVDYSTVYLTLYEKTPRPLARRSFWNRVGEGFVNGWGLLKDLAVGLVSIWPILLILALALGWWIRRRRRR